MFQVMIEISLLSLLLSSATLCGLAFETNLGASRIQAIAKKPGAERQLWFAFALLTSIFALSIALAQGYRPNWDSELPLRSGLIEITWLLGMLMTMVCAIATLVPLIVSVAYAWKNQRIKKQWKRLSLLLLCTSLSFGIAWIYHPPQTRSSGMGFLPSAPYHFNDQRSRAGEILRASWE